MPPKPRLSFADAAAYDFYPEVALQVIESPACVVAKTPWGKYRAPISPKRSGDWEAVARSCNEWSWPAPIPSGYQQLARLFAEDPVLYFRPRPHLRASIGGASAVRVVPEAPAAWLTDILTARRTHHPLDATFNDLELQRTLGEPWNDLLPASWNWPVEAILESSSIDGERFDPISALSILRRHWLRAVTLHPATRELNDTVKTLHASDAGAFLRVMQHWVRGSHHIAYRCQDLLRPALAGFAPAKEVLSAFIASERNHDRLLMRSLTGLGVAHPDDLLPMPEISALAEHVAYQGATHFMSFACLVGIFEDHNSEEEGMLWLDLMRSLPETRAGVRWIKAHFDIDRAHGHRNVSFELLAKFPAVSRQDVVLAARTLELDATVRISMTQRFLGTTK